jgi:hypothetical protein
VESIDALQRTAEIRADNAYAYVLMSRVYALMHRHASDLDPRKAGYKASAIAALHRAEKVPTPDHKRTAWLKSWLKRRDILQSDGSPRRRAIFETTRRRKDTD